eukprot:8069339-Pyramimonas_sp.AAC.1
MAPSWPVVASMPVSKVLHATPNTGPGCRSVRWTAPATVGSTVQSTKRPRNRRINLSINQTPPQPSDQSFNQPNAPETVGSIVQSTKRPCNRRINHSINRRSILLKSYFVLHFTGPPVRVTCQ